MEKKIDENLKKPEAAHKPGEGIRGARSTTFFRLTNFELYARPNKFVMSIGLASLAVSIGLVGYMYYEKYQLEEEVGAPVYKAVDEEGEIQYRPKKSKWDI